MSNNELLYAISDMMDAKLEPISSRLDRIEQVQENDILPRLEKMEHSYERLEQSYERLEQSQKKIELALENDILPRLDNLEQSYERLEQSQKKIELTLENDVLPRLDNLEQSYERLEQSQKKIELTLENDVLPRLQTIESCYLSTFERYQLGVGQIGTMQSDIDVLKTTITKHSEILQKLA